MKRLAFSVALTVAAVGGVAACGDDAPPPAAPTQRPAAKAQAPSAPSPDAGTPAAASPYLYAYNPMGKRDPFRPFVLEARSDELSPICNEPLCQWDLDQLALVAVVSGDANPLAMVEDPNRTGHMIRRNTRVGKQGGKVTQILRDCVVVTEYWTGPDGKINPNPVKLCIRQEHKGLVPTDLLNPQKKWQ